MNDECERNQLRVELQEKSPWIFIQCEMKPQRIYAKNVGKLQKNQKINENLKKIMSICFQLDVL